MSEKMHRPQHTPLRENPAGENNRSPSHIESQRSRGNMGEGAQKGRTVNPREIPNSLGYVGSRVKK